MRCFSISRSTFYRPGHPSRRCLLDAALLCPRLRHYALDCGLPRPQPIIANTYGGLRHVFCSGSLPIAGAGACKDLPYAMARAAVWKGVQRCSWAARLSSCFTVTVCRCALTLSIHLRSDASTVCSQHLLLGDHRRIEANHSPARQLCSRSTSVCLLPSRSCCVHKYRRCRVLPESDPYMTRLPYTVIMSMAVSLYFELAVSPKGHAVH